MLDVTLLPAGANGTATLLTTEVAAAVGLYHIMRKYWMLSGRPETVFRRIARTRFWNSDETVSGVGSTLAATGAVRRELPAIIAEHGITSLLDAGCGDCNWITALIPPLPRYIGVDIVPEIVSDLRRRYDRPGIEFLGGDVTAMPLPQVDLVLARDCLVHLPIKAGDWRPINLEGAPFHLPPPLQRISEADGVDNGTYADKSLALWPVSALSRAAR